MTPVMDKQVPRPGKAWPSQLPLGSWRPPNSSIHWRLAHIAPGAVFDRSGSSPAPNAGKDCPCHVLEGTLARMVNQFNLWFRVWVKRGSIERDETMISELR